MRILVANLGSTSFKYKLFDFAQNERVLAVGASDRIAQGRGEWKIEADGNERAGEADLADHGQAIELHLSQLVELGALPSTDDLHAIGFKAVHGGPISGAVEVNDEVIQTMERISPLAPAHNPPYIQAMRSFNERLPDVRQVAAFETAFHQTIPDSRQVYGVPYQWFEQHGIRRYGFHGASNAYIAARMAEIAPRCKRIINLHLGGSCSVCAIKDGQSLAHSMGATPQTGVFHASRVGEFDPYAIVALKQAGFNEADIYHQLGKNGGLLGISGQSADLRDLEQSAAQSNHRAKLAIDAFVESCRHYLGAYLAVLNGVDAITFTGGIGQHSTLVREAVCNNLDFAGIKLDTDKNKNARANHETMIHHDHANAQTWIIPTNEELVVARQTHQTLNPN